MTNYEWLLQMGGEERQAWFDAEHVEPRKVNMKRYFKPFIEAEQRAIDVENDSREKLEDDVVHECARPGFGPEFGEIMAWLDRQAAITEREVEHDLMLAGRMAVEVERKRIAELTAERDEWKAKAEEAERAMNAAAGKWARADDENRELRKMLLLDDGTVEEYTERADPLTALAYQKQLAEEWRDRCHNAEAWCDKLEAERDELKAFSGRLETAAHDKLGVTLFGVDYVTEDFMLHVRDTLTAERDELKAMNERLQVALDAVEGCDERCLKLEAERDELSDKIGEITDEGSELMKKQPYTFDVHDVPESLRTVGRYIDELTAERDQWREAAGNAHDMWEKAVTERDELQRELDIANAKLIGKPECDICDRTTLLEGVEVLTAERDELREKLGEAIGHAHEIGKLVDLEGAGDGR